MEISIFAIIILSFVSFLAGFIDSIAGGGGILMVPAYLIAGLPAHNLLGTNKFVNIIGTGIAAINYIKNKKTSFKVILSGGFRDPSEEPNSNKFS